MSQDDVDMVVNGYGARIDAMVARLEAVKFKVPAVTFFGDNNRDAIGAQIEVLRDGLTENDVYSEWGEDDHVRDAALGAVEWRDNDGEDIAQGWEDLAA